MPIFNKIIYYLTNCSYKQIKGDKKNASNAGITQVVKRREARGNKHL